MNDQVILLKSDNTVEKKYEKDLCMSDLIVTKYILIPSSSEDGKYQRNYIMNEATPLLCFDKAIINFQLIMKVYAEDIDDFDYEYMKPVNVETDSLIHLINLINCIDRLNCVNNISCEDYMFSGYTTLDVGYFDITLFRNGKVTYAEVYQLSGFDGLIFYSGKITKHFGKIYSGWMTNDMVHDKTFLIMDNHKWKTTEYAYKDGLVGVPLVQSNTITFCTFEEIRKLTDIKSMDITYCVLDIPIELDDDVTNFISCGDYLKFEEIGSNLDYFSSAFHTFRLVKSSKYLHLDILSHLKFVMGMTDLMFDFLYSNYSDLDKLPFQIHSFNIRSVAHIEFNYKDKIKKEIYFTEKNVIPLSQMLEVI